MITFWLRQLKQLVSRWQWKVDKREMKWGQGVNMGDQLKQMEKWGQRLVVQFKS